MKRLSTFLAVTLLAVGCSKIFDTSVLERNIIELKDRVTALEEQCKQMNTNISSLQTIVTALQNNDFVTGVAPISQNGVEVGYTITFSKSGAITIYHGKDGSDGLNGSDGSNGSDGASGSTPVVGVKQDTDGVYYWTLNGEWLLNDKGEKVKAISTDGKDGEDGTDGANGKDGKDGITPQLKIEDGYWYVSYNNGESWEQLGKATGEDGKDGQNGENGTDGAAGNDGKDGDSFFQSVDTSNSDYIIFTLADGTEIKLPTWYAFEQLKTLCNQMNTNLESLQTVVAAMQEGDYITSCTPLMEDGKQIGYTIVFAKMGSIVIYHGKDGANGSDGADGSEGSNGADGTVVVPTIGIKQDTNGIYYWTLDGQWLLDSEGYKVRASPIDGEDGKDGTSGSDGATGKDGVTPQLKIEDGYWYVSYNNGESWEQLGKATGEDGQDGANGSNGQDGAAGKDGDSFFQSVTQDENNVIFTLADGTVITLPKSSSYLFNKLQSVSYIPRYEDGKATVFYSTAENSQVELDFEISPKDAVAEIAAQWETILSLKAVNTQTRAVTYIDMPILSCNADAEKGIITVSASGSNLSEDFFAGTQPASARLGISDGNTNITSEYIQLAAAPATEPLSNEIWYTSTDGNIVEPHDSTVFGANIVSNTYENGRGVILFDGEVTEIGNEAFYQNNSLKSIAIPNSVTFIGENAFLQCFRLSNANLNEGLSEIKHSAFFQCNSLTDITIPNSVTTIRMYAFRECKNIACVIIGENTESIGRFAFYGCENLKELTFGNSLTSIESLAFARCLNLTCVALPDSVISVGESVFNECCLLSEFKGKFASDDKRCLVVNGVLKAFAIGCGVNEYTIPNNVTSIDCTAFENCQTITSITIPDSVTSLSYSMFRNCNSLSEFRGKYSSSDNLCLIKDGILYSFAIGSGTTEYTVSDGINTIMPSAFENCTTLTSVALPNSLTSLYAWAFLNCSNLTKVYCNPTDYPIALRKIHNMIWGSWHAFDGNAADRKIYVPTESVDAYKAADGWKDYADAIVGYNFAQ